MGKASRCWSRSACGSRQVLLIGWSRLRHPAGALPQRGDWTSHQALNVSIAIEEIAESAEDRAFSFSATADIGHDAVGEA